VGSLKSYVVPFEPVGSLKILAIGQAIILLVLWFISPYKLIPNPLEILQAWEMLATTQGMLVELWKSSVTIASAIFYASAITLGLGVLYTAPAFKPIIRWMTSLRFLGFAGITFFFTLWTSDGAALKIWLLTFGMTAFLLTNMLAIIDSVTQEEIDYAKTLGLSGWRATFEVVVRGRMDEAFDLIRQNAAIGWTLLSMVEGLVRYEGGIGALLMNMSKHLNLDAIFAIQLTILVYGILQDYALRWIRNIICPYVALTSAR